MNQSREIHDRPETGENSAASAGPKNSVADTALYWISDVVFSLDQAGNFTYLSPSFRRITGISCDAMIGKHFTAFVPPEQHDSARRRFEIVRGDENGAITFSYSIQLPEKEPIPVEILLNRMEGPAGFEGFAGVARNIEHRYAVASLIGATGEEYRYFIENIEDGYYEVDLKGIFVASNPYFSRLMGYEAGEIIGLRYVDVVDEETAGLLFSQFHDLYVSGGSRGLISGTYITKNGEKRIAEGTVTLRRDRGGAIVGFCGLIRDITERMNLEAALKASESKWRRLYNSLPGGAILIDADRIIIDVNRITCEITGYRYDELVGKSCGLICPAHERDCDLPGKGLVEFDNIETGLRRADGSVIQIIKSADLIETPDGPLILENFHDVTHLKDIESALRTSEENLRKKNETMEKELHAAQLIQKNIIGAAIPAMKEVRGGYRYIPMADVGGDFFSITPLNEGGAGIFIGDVSSHGVSAALFLALIKATTDRVCREHALSPKQYITRLNAELYGNMPLSFMTAVYGVFRRTAPDRCDFTFSSAGHPWPILYRADSGKSEFVNSKGTLLGMFDDLEFDETTLSLGPGDRVYLYTDGVPEMVAPSKVIWGYERMRELVESTYNGSIEASLDGIIGMLDRFRGDEPISDDMVIMTFEA